MKPNKPTKIHCPPSSPPNNTTTTTTNTTEPAMESTSSDCFSGALSTSTNTTKPSTKFFDIGYHSSEICTTLTSTEAGANFWISKVYRIYKTRLRNLFVGLHTQKRNQTSSEDEPKTAILQLCVGDHCLIFQLSQGQAVPNSLVKFLSNPNFTFGGVGVKKHAQQLFDDWHLKVSKTMDIADPIASLTYGFTGKDKRESDVLHDGVMDAAILVFVSYKFGKLLHSGNVESSSASSSLPRPQSQSLLRSFSRKFMKIPQAVPQSPQSESRSGSLLKRSLSRVALRIF